ncbi:MAG: hypothetical protein HY901_31750 [Deltaproteobacteria bacterium]|nr:hypothetical protein [Deltaproteobacteria bacterium]
MIETYVSADFEEPPAELAFELRFADLLREVERAAQLCLGLAPGSSGLREAATRLYIVTQAIPSVLLNYKICIEFGLPLHPTQYIDFVRHEKNPEAYLPSTREAAQELYLEAIDIARAVYRLDPRCAVRLSGLRGRIPEFLTGFLYSNTPDRYTWRASEPARVQKLAQEIRASGWTPDVIVGAAHGSIRPALLLAEQLGSQLYFLRFSMFKRDDEQPILSSADERWLARFQERRLLLFDEDVAKGRTLKAFELRLSGFARECRTASVLRHYLAPYQPSYVGEVFYDE